MVVRETRAAAGEGEEATARSCIPLACLRGSKARKRRRKEARQPPQQPPAATAANNNVHNNNNNNYNNGGLEGKYRVAAPELMQDTFMSDSEDEGGEVECPLQQQQQYRYMHAETNTLQRARPLEDSVTDGHRWPSNNDAAPERPARTDKGFLVSFVVDARGGAMKALRRGGVRVIVPPNACAAPTRVTCRAVTRRAPAAAPPPLMEGEALSCRLLELQPQGAKFLAPVVIEVPIFSTPCREREIVILRSDTGETWQDHYLHVADNPLVQEALARERLQEEGEEGERVTRIVTCDFPHYLAVVTRIKQEVHIIGAEGGTISSSAIPQVQALFPPNALTKRIRVGVQAHGAPPELTRRVLPRAVAVSPVLTVEPRRRKFHRTITLTMPLPHASDGTVSGATPATSGSLRLLCSIMGGQARAVWEDVTGSTPLSVADNTASFTTTVSARFWLMDCRNVADATKLATELYREMLLVSFEARLVVLAQRLDALEGRLLVLYLTDRATCDSLLQQPHYTEVAHSTAVRLRDTTSVHLEFSGNLLPVTKSGEQPSLKFEAFKDNRVEFTVRLKRHDEMPTGRVYFMNEPKVGRGQQSQTPVCVLDVALPASVTPRAAKSQQDCLNLDQSGFDALHDELGSHWDSSLLSGGGGTTPRPAPAVPQHLTNGHAKGVSNGDVRREHPDITPAAGDGRATFDSDEERTPGNTLEKHKQATPTPPSQPTPPPTPATPAPPTTNNTHIIDEQLLNKVEDMFKDLKTQPQGELADIAEEPEQQQQQQQHHHHQQKQQQHVGHDELDRALRTGAEYAGQVVSDNLTTIHAQATNNLLDAETRTDMVTDTLTDKSQQLADDISTGLTQAERRADWQLNQAKETARDLTSDVINTAHKVAVDAGDSINTARDHVADQTSTFFTNVQHTADNTLSEANDKFSNLKDSTFDKVNDSKQAMTDALNDTKQATADKISDAKQTIASTTNEVSQVTTDKLNSAKQTVTDALNDAKHSTADNISDAKQTISSTANDVSQVATDKLNSAKQTVTDALNDAKHATADKISDAKQTISSTANEVSQVATDRLNSAKQTVTDAANDVRQNVSETTNDVKLAASDKWDDITHGVESAREQASCLVGDMCGRADGAVRDVTRDVESAAGNTRDQYTNNAHQLGGSVEREAEQLVEEVLSEAVRVRDGAGEHVDTFTHTLNSIGSDVFALHSSGGLMGSADMLEAERAAHHPPAPADPASTNNNKKGSGIPKLKKKKK